MNFTEFNIFEIERQVLDFMRALGIEPYDEHLQIDGELHRYRVHDDTPGDRSGAYCIFPDGVPAGFVQDWHGVKSNWTFDTSGYTEEQKKFFNSPEFQKQAAENKRKREEEKKRRQAQAAEQSRTLFERLAPAPENHPYLQAKKINNYGFRIQENRLAVPLRNIDGVLQSIQWIDADGEKRFQMDAPLDGAFWSIALDTLKEKPGQIILLGEGIATMAKVYELTELPCVAALTCGKLAEIAGILRGKYPKNKIVVLADNDKATELKHGFNPGVTAAEAAVKSGFVNGYAVPSFKSPDDGTDWDDFANLYGEDATIEVLREQIREACLSEEQKRERKIREALSSLAHDLNPSTEIAPQEFVGGLFPRKYVSLLVAPPGTGKTIFMQKFSSDLSIGGSIFDGFAEDEPPRKILILAGEAGYELLLRRAASMKWAINPQNVKVIDQHEAEQKNLSVMLDDKEGGENIKRLVDMYKPDIIFFDSFMSFHDRDENKAPDMKPIVQKLSTLANDFNIAVVLVHHSRKRLAKERTLSLNQDDVIGSSVFNRLVGLIVAIEPMKEDERTLLVRPLKSWFATFMPFTYKLTENLYGGTTIQTDLAPASVNSSKIAVWNYLRDNFEVGEWFSFSQIILSEIEGNVTEWQLRRILTHFVKNGKLQRKGFTKNLEYSLIDTRTRDE